MNGFLRALAMISLMRMAAEMLLPEGPLRQGGDRLLGLFQMLNMLRALERLMHGGWGW